MFDTREWCRKNASNKGALKSGRYKITFVGQPKSSSPADIVEHVGKVEQIKLSGEKAIVAPGTTYKGMSTVTGSQNCMMVLANQINVAAHETGVDELPLPDEYEEEETVDFQRNGSHS